MKYFLVVLCFLTAACQVCIGDDDSSEEQGSKDGSKDLRKNVSSLWSYVHGMRQRMEHDLHQLHQHQMEVTTKLKTLFGIDLEQGDGHMHHMHKEEQEHTQGGDHDHTEEHHGDNNHSHEHHDEHHNGHHDDHHNDHHDDHHNEHHDDHHNEHHSDHHHDPHHGEDNHGDGYHSYDHHGDHHEDYHRYHHSEKGHHHDNEVTGRSHDEDHQHHGHTAESGHDHQSESNSHGHHGHEEASHNHQSESNCHHGHEEASHSQDADSTHRHESHGHQHEHDNKHSHHSDQHDEDDNSANDTTHTSESHHHHHHQESRVHHSHHHDESSHTHSSNYDFAICSVEPNTAIPPEKQQNVTGKIRLWQKINGTTLHIHIKVKGFNMGGQEDHAGHESGDNTPSGHLHGFHVHQEGDLSNGCQSTGPHYNPTGVQHGGPNSSVRHVGDLGNIECDQHGVTNVMLTDEIASLQGEYSIIGKAIVIHEKNDDLGTNPDNPASVSSGDAGARIACCVIQQVDRLSFSHSRGHHGHHHRYHTHDHHRQHQHNHP